MSTETLTMPEPPIAICEPTKKAEKAKERAPASPASQAGTIWFIGWLFTIGFAKLVWWKALLAIIVWPYFLGIEVR